MYASYSAALCLLVGLLVAGAVLLWRRGRRRTPAARAPAALSRRQESSIRAPAAGVGLLPSGRDGAIENVYAEVDGDDNEYAEVGDGDENEYAELGDGDENEYAELGGGDDSECMEMKATSA